MSEPSGWQNVEMPQKTEGHQPSAADLEAARGILQAPRMNWDMTQYEMEMGKIIARAMEPKRAAAEEMAESIRGVLTLYNNKTFEMSGRKRAADALAAYEREGRR